MNFEAAASETFQILRSYDYEVVLFDEEHNQVFEPNEARRFFAKPVNLLVSLVDDGEDSTTRLYLSKSTRISQVIGLVQSLRAMATKYKMVFNVREYNRDLSPKDFATQASVSESKVDLSMNICEGMYGTSRSSYLKLEHARMIVRHSTRINENILGARGRNVETIHIENNVGERYLMPTQQLAPARAMAHHVDNGGTWADPVGEQIARMAQNFADLGAASRHIGHYAPELCESAVAIRDTVREAARAMRKTFESLGRKTRYAEVAESLAKAGETLTEDAHFAEQAGELAAKLNTESVQLSERVLTTVARTLAEAEAAAAALQEDNEPTVSVRGHVIHKSAWEALKQGHIDLTSPVTAVAGQNPLLVLRKVIVAAKDDTLSNFLSFILHEMQKATASAQVTGGSADSGYGQVVAAVMRAVGAGGRPEGEPAPTPAVREFMEWARRGAQPVMEYDRFEEPDHRGEDRANAAIEQAVDRFDYNDFIASPFATEFHHDQLAHLSDEERVIPASAVLSAVEGYLEDAVSDLGHGVDVAGPAHRLTQYVLGEMQKDGYQINVAEDACNGDRDMMGIPELATDDQDTVDENCGECADDQDPLHRGDPAGTGAGSEDLTHEDVVLPQGEPDVTGDFISDVSKREVDGPEGEQRPDDNYVNRLLSLSGQRR